MRTKLRKLAPLALAGLLLAAVWVTVSYAAPAEQTLPPVIVSIQPPTTTVMAGEVFSVAIQLETGDAGIDSFETLVNFDPTYLQVVDALPGEMGVQIQPTDALVTPVRNEADNATGQIEFARAVALVPNPTLPTGTFDVAHIILEAQAATDGTDITFADTVANLEGFARDVQTVSGVVIIEEPPAPAIGGITSPASALQLLAPWFALVALAGLLLAGGVMVLRRRAS